MSQNVDMIRSLYESFSRGDVPAVLAQLDPQIHWNEAENFIYADGNPYIGPTAVLQGVFIRIPADWENFTVTPEQFLDAGGHVVVQGIYAGTHKGTGKNVRAQFAHVWSLDDGKCKTFQQYTDTKQFAEAAAL